MASKMAYFKISITFSTRSFFGFVRKFFVAIICGDSFSSVPLQSTTPRSNHLVTILNRFIGSVIDEPIPPAEFDYSDLTENSEKLHPPSVLPSKPSKLSTKRPSCLAICIYKDIATRQLLYPTTIKLSQALIFFSIFSKPRMSP